MALKITLHHGKVGEKPVTRKNLEALGLRKIGQSVVCLLYTSPSPRDS